jgi:hypothetical protein
LHDRTQSAILSFASPTREPREGTRRPAFAPPTNAGFFVSGVPMTERESPAAKGFRS